MSRYKVIYPANDAQQLHTDIERFFGCGRERREEGFAAAHGVYIGQDDANLYVEALTAGLDPASIQVTFDDQVLSVAAERPGAPESPENVRWVRQERQRGALSFQFRIPKPVDIEAINADYRNGILLVTLPKSGAAQTRTIPVNTA